ncbi:excinuclease ABC subunit C [compost metagenome]
MDAFDQVTFFEPRLRNRNIKKFNLVEVNHALYMENKRSLTIGMEMTSREVNSASNHVARFSLSITRAMEDQLLSLLKEKVVPIQLTFEALSALHDEPGVYQLFLDGEPVYIGKADKSLRARIMKHYTKLSGRVSMASDDRKTVQLASPLLARIEFVCLYVMEDLNSMAPEKMLIKHYRSDGKSEWNVNGFGNNDPGRNRDRSMVKRNHFDRLHPIDLEIQITLDSHDKDAQPDSVLGLMTGIKRSLPYLFRFPARNSSEHKILSVADENLRQYAGQTKRAREWFDIVSLHLPVGWQIISLPGYVICYPESNPAVYESRTGSWATGLGVVDFSRHEAKFGTDGKIQEESLADDQVGMESSGID